MPLRCLGTILLLSLAAGALAHAGEAEPIDLNAMMSDYQRPSEIPAPSGNEYSPQRAALGRALFFDPRLSGSGALSCASCHNPALAWADGLKTGIGHMGSRLPRHTPAIENLAWGGPFFWDGRAATLEEQAKGPLAADKEMNMPLASVASTVASMSGYQSAFASSYPGEPITIDTIAKAIANFERTVVSPEAPFDRWIEGDDEAVSDAAKRGFVLFNTKARCAVCHQTWRFTDDGFRDIGVRSSDKGRGRIVQGLPLSQFAFKTPSLRNVALRAPYMHDGSERTLRAVIDFYAGGFIQRASLSPDIKRIDLSEEEKRDLVAFLETLTSDSATTGVPVLPQRYSSIGVGP